MRTSGPHQRPVYDAQLFILRDQNRGGALRGQKELRPEQLRVIHIFVKLKDRISRMIATAEFYRAPSNHFRRSYF
jgi:hypothetical protein